MTPKTVVEELIEEKMREFDKKFVGDDLMIEKYYDNGYMSDAIKDFLKSSLTLAYNKGKSLKEKK
jgi:hypothetical protein